VFAPVRGGGGGGGATFDISHVYRASTMYRPIFGDAAVGNKAGGFLNSVSGLLVTLRSSKSRVYLLKDRDPVGPSASRSIGISKWTVLIGRTGFDTVSSITNLTLSLTTRTRRTLRLQVPPPRHSMSIYPDGKSCGHVRLQFECWLSMTLLRGPPIHGGGVPSRAGGVRDQTGAAQRGRHCSGRGERGGA
jgi:hypothetical protein